MGISLDAVDKIIFIESPATEVTIQELVNAIRDWESELLNLGCEVVIEAVGKADLGGGVKTGITLTLINNWRVQFEPRTPPNYTLCVVKGGNLVAINDYDNNPICPSAYTQVTIAQSTSASVVSTGGSALTFEEHNQLMELPSKEETADQTWDTPVISHGTEGTFGQYVSKVKKWVGWMRSLV